MAGEMSLKKIIRVNGFKKMARKVLPDGSRQMTIKEKEVRYLGSRDKYKALARAISNVYKAQDQTVWW